MRRELAVVVMAVTATCAYAQQPKAAVVPAPASWADSVTVKGDIRYRYEDIKENGKPDRQRDRIRVRLGIDGKISDELSASAGLSTGKNEPTSGNQTLGNTFAGKGMYLDYAQFNYILAEPLTVMAGKLKNPYMCIDDLVWDTDVTPDGLAMQYKFNVIENAMDINVNAGYHWLLEQANSTKDQTMYAGQLAMIFGITDEIKLTVGGSVYDFQNIKGTPFTQINYAGEEKGFGNSSSSVKSGTNTVKVYAQDFNEVEYFAELSYWIPSMEIPLRFTGHIVENTEASSNNKGIDYGIALGKAKNPKTYEIGYNYIELKKDAVLGALTDSDRWGGGTDGKGNKLFAKYQMAKNWQLGFTYYMNNDKGLAKPVDYNRYFLDLVASF